ncbi:anti-sigma-k factor [Leptolyngbya sp. Heron Island J]|uniref:anti-sigma K factor n=1 Tax=Leptolyngbya sp. Heron Island J TaxID=1385935 RepID=UPI0003B95778|nr:anti-sigma K factor [Leptolyngbya sp. Heron Island J]ESA37587.1 anti-sigma-k factor [Leptolyngbya sp. Heron Island J]
MTAPLSPQEIQELTAGYVLGDLTSSEAETFRSLLAEQPELQAEVTSLQEALAMMPYGLDEVEPELELRSQILSAAQAELAHQLTATPQKPKKRLRLRLPWAMSTVAAGFAIAFGVANLHLNNQVRSLQAQYHQPELADTPASAGIHQTWSGLSQLLQDHQRSLTNPEGPVDFVVQQPGEILELLQGFQTTVAALPLIPSKQGLLLGGSNCQLGETSGLRLTYRLETNQTVSAYQLALAEEEFPEFQSAQLTLQQPDGTGIVLWRDETYLYALVAELPMSELQNLAYAIEGT